MDPKEHHHLISLILIKNDLTEKEADNTLALLSDSDDQYT